MPLSATAERGDREKPINVESDRVTVDDARQISVFEGNVVLTQGTMVIRGDRMEVRQDKEGFKLGTVWGNLAYFKQKREGLDENVEGWGERIEYDDRTDRYRQFYKIIQLPLLEEINRATGGARPALSRKNCRLRGEPAIQIGRAYV